jgi:amino acid adenylation domain-containing protein/thioester reductase-like protein
MITGRIEPLPPPFLDLLEQRASQWGDAVAIECGGTSMTYRELLLEAETIAAILKANGVKKGDYVGVLMPASSEFFSTVLAVWWLGAAFVPVDPAYPQARRESIFAKGRCACVVTNRATSMLSLGSIVIESRKTDLELAHLSCPRADIGSEDVAYLIFTSGSTGQPKGVVVPHRGVTNILEEQRRVFGITTQSRILWYLSIGFDAAISDFGTAFLAGATIVIPEERERAPSVLPHTLQARAITHIDMPPVVAARIAAHQIPESVQCIVLGGEVTPAATVRSLLAPKRKVFNVYGPTEATICVSMVECTPEWDLPYLGTPVPNTMFKVVAPAGDGDKKSEDVEYGELWIGGAGVAQSFLDNHDMTTERFVYSEGIRWYRSGDFVSLRDGRVTYHGRQDRQVKVRGAIANLAEVEAVCESHAKVAKAAAFKNHDGVVVAIVLSEKNCGWSDLLLQELSTLCFTRLPSWMIPRQMFVIPELPTNDNGKIDYRHLGTMCPPRLEVERSNGLLLGADGRSIVDAISRVLRCEACSLDRSFLDLGGDSLTALEVSSLLEAESGILLSQEQLLFAPSLQKLLDSRSERGMHTQELEAYCSVSKAITRRLARRAAIPPKMEPERLLVTGATGSLGREIVRELLRRTSAQVVCLVRGADDADAYRRLKQQLHPECTEWERLVVVQGDLAKPLLGLRRSVWRALAQSLDAVWHIAADTSGVQDPARAREGSVRGMNEILRLISWGKPKWLHYASTLSVITSTSRSPSVIRSDDTLREPCEVFGGYAQGKWISERILHRMPLHYCSIYRLGLLVSRERPSTLATLVALMRAERLAPVTVDTRLAIEAISVRGAAQKMVCNQQVGVVHTVRGRPISLRSLVTYAGRQCSPFLEVSGRDFLKQIQCNVQSTPLIMAAIAAIGSGQVARPEISVFEISGWQVERSRS